MHIIEAMHYQYYADDDIDDGNNYEILVVVVTVYENYDCIMTTFLHIKLHYQA